MDNESLLRIKQTQAQETFWKEVLQKQTELGLSDFEVDFSLYVICGMPSWYAVAMAAQDHPEEDLVAHLPTDLSARRSLGKIFATRRRIVVFQQWARLRSQELYTLDLRAFDWQFKDGESELRFLIEVAHSQLAQGKLLSSEISNTILSAVKELNAMYKFNGNTSDVGRAKLVIFTGEDDLPA